MSSLRTSYRCFSPSVSMMAYDPLHDISIGQEVNARDADVRTGDKEIGRACREGEGEGQDGASACF